MTCKHEWRQMRLRPTDVTRRQTVYPFYCIHCLKIKDVEDKYWKVDNK